MLCNMVLYIIRWREVRLWLVLIADKVDIIAMITDIGIVDIG